MCAESSKSGAESGHEAIARAAAQWLARRDRGLTSAEAEELFRWCGADARHAAELDRLEKAWRDLDQARCVPELVEMAQGLDRATAVRRSPRWSAPLPALASFAAAVALAAGLVWWRMALPPSPGVGPAEPGYQVLASGAKRLVFADGSVAEVRDQGEVRAEFTPDTRRVRLIRGEAHFEVTKDPARRFIVSVGGIDVRAVGTAFNVRMAPETVEVLVTEGTVQVVEAEAPVVVEAPLLAAGQHALVQREAARGAAPRIDIRRLEAHEIDESLAWQSARLVFNRTPLADAVEAFNRQSSGRARARLVIGDSALRAKRLGGTVRASNVEGFVRLLEQTAEVRVERKADVILLRSTR